MRTETTQQSPKDNEAYLKDQIKYLGFGDHLHPELGKNIREGKNEFQLRYETMIDHKRLSAVLHFRQSEQSANYFLNNYRIRLEGNNGTLLEQTFYIHKGKGVTAKEAYNLLEGRSVYKELTNKAGVAYKAWIQLDFTKKDKHGNHEVKQFHENYGYDLRASLSKFAIAEMDGGEIEHRLMQSLQKGNIPSVTIEKNGLSHQLFVEARPQFKAVQLYDLGMKRLAQEHQAAYMKSDQRENNTKDQPLESTKAQAVNDKRHGKNKSKDPSIQ